MRYDTLVKFINEKGRDEYDPETGGMKDTTPEDVERLCSVNDLTAKKKTELFGRMTERAISIHYQGKMIEAQKVSIDKGIYKGTYTIYTSRALRNKATAIATELVNS